jgi:hypothetical protein
MTTIVTRSGKGSPLTHTEVDTNFTNLNTAKLETAAIPLGTLQAPSVSFLNDSDTGIFCPQGGNSLAIATGGQYAITCTSTQAVGIQTANPNAALHVAGNARVGADDVTDAVLEIGAGASGNRTSYIDIVADTTYTDYGLRVIRNNTGANATSELKHRGTGALNFTTEEAAPIVFYTTNSPALTITSGGLVGIGTSSPGEKLQIDDGNIRLQGTNPGKIYFVSTGNGVSNNATLEVLNNGIVTNTGEFRFSARNQSNTLAERMRISAEGRVGIGTTSPGVALDVVGDIRMGSGNNLYFNVTSGFSPRLTNSGSQNDLSFFTNNTEHVRLDSDGRLLVGTTTSRSTYNAGDAPKFQVESVTAGATVGITFNSDNANSSELYLAKARGSAVNSHTIVQNNDNLGILFFGGADGTNIIRAASVGAQVDGTATINAGSFVASRRYKIATVGTTDFTAIGASANTVGVIFTATGVGAGTGTATSEPYANSMPGRLVFSTTADGASSPTERMRITSYGTFLASNAGSYPTTTGTYHAFSANSPDDLILRLNNTSSTNPYGVNVVFDAAAPNDTTRFFLNCADNAALRATIRSNGGLANYSANNANLSDRNVKKDISPAANTWNCIKEWEIVNYRYKDQPDDADLNLGVIAQQVAESCPEVITIFQEAKEATEDKPAQEERLGVKEQQMYWMAIKALQEAMGRIEQLETKVAALESA